MPAPQRIRELVESFDRNVEQYKRAANETQVRREFIDPFFKELGWDIDNSAGAAMQYQDVIHEDQLKIGGTSKAPDYGFRIGGTLKFFVEAKKPSIDVKMDAAPAYQVRNYGWNKKLAISIVTDFEEFAIYDCTVKPKPTDKPSVARINYYTYKDYIQKWDEIANIFSKDGVIKGNFDKFAAGTKGKRGTTTVDKDILLSIEHWREILAKNIAKNNSITEDELKFATQRILDRIIFLRICEARAIEEDGRLLEAVKNTNSFKNLFTLFQAADNRYNSGLFYFRKGDKAHHTEAELDTITPRLKLDDKVIKEIIENLYYPKSQYLFDVIPADILGQVYEQFLGKVIRMTSGGMVKIEEKPEVRKAGGVYYTPTYIVDYIVKNTVGKMLEDNSPSFSRRGSGGGYSLNILDPACGSGSFLLGAYNYLLNYYLHEYSTDAKKLLAQKNSPIYEVSKDIYALTTPERKRILLEHIYGVDIDEQAVEVAKLNLMLKCLEGEAGTNLKLSVERILPDLSDNIKCGNSLIGPDFTDGLFAGENKKINAFDWSAEFPDIMKHGGFDVVIGNPPWGAEFSSAQKDYLMDKFSQVHMRTPDSFNYFLANATNLTKQKAKIGFILPNNFLFQHEYAKARKYITENTSLRSLINLGDGVFNVTAPSCIVVLENVKSSKDKIHVADLRTAPRAELAQLIGQRYDVIYPSDILEAQDNIITFNRNEAKLVNRILRNNPTTLGDICDEVAAGIGTGGDKIFRIDDKLAKSLGIEKDILFPVLVGRDFNAYYLPSETDHSIIYSTKTVSAKTHPITLKYLSPYREQLANKRETRKGLIPWSSLHWPRFPELFSAPKIILRQTASSLYATIDDKGYYCLNSVIIVRLKDKANIRYVTGLLNSKLIRWLYHNFTQEAGRVFAEVKPINVRKLPFRAVDLLNKSERQTYEALISLVDRMIDLNQELPQAKTPQSRMQVERQIAHTDNEIDRLVYGLYGLSEEEIKIVEGGQ